MICSDGDMMEGVSQEAASVAGNFALGKLIVCYDENHITIDGTTSLSFDGENHAARMADDGWHVQRVEDSEDLARSGRALLAARAKKASARRSSRSALTSPIRPPTWSTAPSRTARPSARRRCAATKRVMGFDPDEPLLGRRARVRAHVAARAGRRRPARVGRALRALARGAPGDGRGLGQGLVGRLRDGWREALPSFAAGEELATRAAGQKTMAAFSRFAPTMIGGAADLVESTKTVFEGAGEFGAVHAGRNVPFGIREHAMGSIVNGAAAHGGIVKPYGSTFLIFSDYMRGAVRLSALMELPVVWVWTHDSIALGEDGPTHQPVEHYTALRAIPFLWVIRPADANETAVAWRVALERPDGPVALLLSRQAIPVLDRSKTAPGRGARAGRLRAVGLARDRRRGRRPGADPDRDRGGGRARRYAAEELAGEGRRVRVVSMPCMELFEAQSAGVPRAGAARRDHRQARDRAGREHELVAVGGPARGGARARPLRRLGAG